MSLASCCCSTPHQMVRAPGVEPGSDRYERPVLPLNEARSKWSGRRGSNPHPHLGKMEFSAVEPRPRNWWTRSESNRGLPGANRRLLPIELQAPNCKTNIAAPAAAITPLAPSARASTNLPGRLRCSENEKPLRDWRGSAIFRSRGRGYPTEPPPSHIGLSHRLAATSQNHPVWVERGWRWPQRIMADLSNELMWPHIAFRHEKAISLGQLHDSGSFSIGRIP
jgi:hypothetical protein